MSERNGDGSSEQWRGRGGVTWIPCDEGVIVAWDLGKEDSTVVCEVQHPKEAS